MLDVCDTHKKIICFLYVIPFTRATFMGRLLLYGDLLGKWIVYTKVIPKF